MIRNMAYHTVIISLLDIKDRQYKHSRECRFITHRNSLHKHMRHVNIVAVYYI